MQSGIKDLVLLADQIEQTDLINLLYGQRLAKPFLKYQLFFLQFHVFKGLCKKIRLVEFKAKKVKSFTV